MPRNMSFALTTRQVIDQTKTVTRRFGWSFLKTGDELWAVEKGMGLKPGEKIKRLAKIRVTSIRAEPLSAMTNEDCSKEGFPSMTAANFIEMLISHYGKNITQDSTVNRIEFEYLPTPPTEDKNDD